MNEIAGTGSGVISGYSLIDNFITDSRSRVATGRLIDYIAVVSLPWCGGAAATTTREATHDIAKALDFSKGLSDLIQVGFEGVELGVEFFDGPNL